jgi:hypothetical protein
MNVKKFYDRVYTKRDGAPCNICELVKPLTEDHVPPKCCLEELRLQLEPFEHRLRAAPPALPLSQNGVRYKTLCGSCNSMLGLKWDPTLARLLKDVRQWLRSPLLLGDRWSVGTSAEAIVRCLFGHLLAATTDDAQTKTDALMREYLNGKRERPAAQTNVFYWLHNHDSVGVIRGIGMPAVRGRLNGPTGIFSIVKIPPMEFLVADLDEYEQLPRLAPAKTNCGELQSLRFWRSLHRQANWPERVDEGNYVIGGASLHDAVTARPKAKRTKP